MNKSKGDYVVVQFPNSCFRLGGTVMGIITVNNQPSQYVVAFISGIRHHTFSADCIVG